MEVQNHRGTVLPGEGEATKQIKATFRSEISTRIPLATTSLRSPIRHAAVAPQRPLPPRAAPPAPLRCFPTRRRRRGVPGRGGWGYIHGGFAGGARPHLLPVLLPHRHPRGNDQGKATELAITSTTA